MRRSFKEHLEAYCLARGYKYQILEDVGGWLMRIEGKIRILSSVSKKGYEATDTVYGLHCWCTPSQWELMCMYVEAVMKQYEKEKTHEETTG